MYITKVCMAFYVFKCLYPLPHCAIVSAMPLAASFSKLNEVAKLDAD